MGITLEQKNTRNLDYFFKNDAIKSKSFFLQKKIIKWYLNNGRKFPWRNPKATDYDKLIAEFFLQKTRAENVVNVYNEFLNEFPNLEAITSANADSIEIIIKPLGLYKNRSRNLQKCARAILDYYDGKIPDSRDDLLKLPGIGIYIANAYLISQFGLRLAVVDTNFKRVYGRFFSAPMEGDPRRNPFLIKFAEFILPKNNIKEYTYGILDFAALICKNKNSRCKECILNTKCEYYNNK